MSEVVPASRSTAAPGPGAGEIGRVLGRHRLLLGLALLVGAAIGLGLAALRAPTYESAALVLVGERRVPNLAAMDLLSGAADARRVGTEMELLRSRSLAKAVVDSLGLQLRVAEPDDVRRSEVIASAVVPAEAAQATFRLTRGSDGRFDVRDERTERALGRFAPGEAIALGDAGLRLAPGAAAYDELVIRVVPRVRAVESLVRNLEIDQPGEDANLIRVRYRGSDPKLVRDVPNVLTARFLTLRESMQKSEARSRVSLLRHQLDTLAQQLSVSEDRLRDFREANRVVDPRLEATTQIGHIAELRAERATLEAERASLSRLLADLQALDASREPGDPSPYRRLIAFPTLLRNVAASELLRSLAAVENERASLLARRSPEDPDVRVLSDRVAELEQQLKGIASTYLQSISSQLAAMDASLGEYRAQLDESPGREVDFDRLSRQPEILTQMYGLLQTRLKEAELAESVDEGSVRVVDTADLPVEPVGPGAPLYAAVSGALLLLIAAGLVLAREYADTTVRTRADVQAALGVPVLGFIPSAGSSRRRWSEVRLPRPRALLPSKGSRTPSPPAGGAPSVFGTGGAEARALSNAYTRLHANLAFARPAREGKVLLFTSALPGEGKTSTAINFATTLAEGGLKVLLIDADLRRGRIHEAFGAPPGPGLTHLLGETPELDGVLRRVRIEGGPDLRFVTVGRHLVNPVNLLGSPAMHELLRVVSEVYDRVVVDTPPLGLFPDAAVLSAHVDGVVVVARANETPFDALVETGEQLERAGGRMLGAVLNGVNLERDAVYDRAYQWYRLGEEYAAASPAAAPAPELRSAHRTEGV